MNSAKEKLEEKNPKHRKGSKKLVSDRNNSILSTYTKDTKYDQSICQSRMSFNKDVPDFSELERSRLKIKELTEERSNLLDVIQSNEKELEFCTSIISQFVDLNELLKIKQKSVFDEKNRVWNIPNFIVQQRKTVFPKLHKSQLKEVLQAEMKQRKIVFKHTESECESTGRPEMAIREGETFIEGEGRPVTSISKHRTNSMFYNSCHEDHRRSPALIKPKAKL